MSRTVLTVSSVFAVALIAGVLLLARGASGTALSGVSTYADGFALAAAALWGGVATWQLRGRR